MFKLIKKENKARRGVFSTPHGDIQTPVFMNVATAGAIKGAVGADDLKNLGCQVALCNTYHMYLRPGDGVVKEMGGLRSFINWDGPTLTDSGGFQVFSLAALRKIDDNGVHFSSHIDGRKLFMGPRESIRIQSNLGSTIAMAFDECVANPAEKNYVEKSCERTLRWLHECKEEIEKLNSLPDTVNKDQMLFGINQGGVYPELRIKHMKQICGLDLSGYAIGGLAVGESAEQMYEIIESVEAFMPEDRPRYLMGVGTPVNILEAVERGVDFFDCVMPSRNARHGHVFTSQGVMNIMNLKYECDPAPLDESCECPSCKSFSRSYIRHLLKAEEMLGMRLAVMHNLHFYNKLLKDIRNVLDAGSFASFKAEKLPIYGRRI